MSSQTRKAMMMNDGLVILGTVAIVGLVAVATVALVYNRGLWVKGSSGQIEVKTGEGRSDVSTFAKTTGRK